MSLILKSWEGGQPPPCPPKTKLSSTTVFLAVGCDMRKLKVRLTPELWVTHSGCDFVGMYKIIFDD